MSSHSFSVTPTELKRLGSHLVEAGLLDQVQIDVALADQAATGVRFGDILVLRGWIKEQTIEYFMRKIILPEWEAVARESLADTELEQQSAKRCLQWARDHLLPNKSCLVPFETGTVRIG